MTHSVPAQMNYYVGPQTRGPAVTRVQEPPVRIIYYRGADGRIYGVAAPAALARAPLTRHAPAPTSPMARAAAAPLKPRMSRTQAPPAAPARIVIEDVGAETVVESNTVTDSSTVIDSSARLQAEAALDRFQRLQGVAKESESDPRDAGTDVAQAVSSAERAPENLPPPKAY